MKMIELHNQEYREGKHSFAMAMNAFGDMTSEEFRQVVNGFQYQNHRKGKVFQEPLLHDIPKSVDWREKGYVTPVKDQCSWGSGRTDGRKTEKLVSLTVQTWWTALGFKAMLAAFLENRYFASSMLPTMEAWTLRNPFHMKKSSGDWEVQGHRGASGESLLAGGDSLQSPEVAQYSGKHQGQCHPIEDALQMLSGGDEDHNEDKWPHHDMRSHLAGKAQV
ncbi:putative inactive cathepsin L-like protein CTSL3P [Pongo abelii]|uniref:putative inactive cathepsin L-like protein CTSL3P n=1 Tax=Pongo abelii TaxID=9601 RepID=UPI00300774D1